MNTKLSLSPKPETLIAWPLIRKYYKHLASAQSPKPYYQALDGSSI